jgi:small-conductance mechanosensitive channel
MFELELVVWSIEMSYRPRAFRSDLNFEIERRFREAGIEWPRSRRDIRVSTPLALQGMERQEDIEREQRDEKQR